MRVRYEMAYSTGFPTWQAECDLSNKKARSMFENLRNDKYCVWAELVSEDEDTFMDVLEGFDHADARKTYETDQMLKKICKELFG